MSDSEDDVLDLHGTTHRLTVSPTMSDTKWPLLLTIDSPAGKGSALLTHDDVDKLAEFFAARRTPVELEVPCRCPGYEGQVHERGATDCWHEVEP